MANAKYVDSVGRYRTKSLFAETCPTSFEGAVLEPLYTLKEQDIDHKRYGKLKSARKIFLECEDPTEYDPAIKLLDSWAHWERLCETSWFKVEVEAWRVELEVKLRSKAVRSIALQSLDPKGTSAAKWIAEAKWKGTRGRPSKAEVERERKIHAGITTEISEDLERLGMKH